MTIITNGVDTTLNDIYTEAEVIENHIHPALSVTTPNGRLRVAALSLNSAPANTETITLAKAGAGFYVRMRSNQTSTSAWIDFKAQYHVYPSAL